MPTWKYHTFLIIRARMGYLLVGDQFTVSINSFLFNFIYNLGIITCTFPSLIHRFTCYFTPFNSVIMWMLFNKHVCCHKSILPMKHLVDKVTFLNQGRASPKLLFGTVVENGRKFLDQDHDLEEHIGRINCFLCQFLMPITVHVILQHTNTWHQKHNLLGGLY